MKITKISKQQRGDRYNLFDDETFIVGISAAVLARSGLSVGEELTADRLASLQDDEGYGKALAKAYDYLARRPHATVELKRKLIAKEFDGKVIERTLAHLEHEGYLDDLAFAKIWISSRGSSRGDRLLRQELRRKGVADEVVDQALAEEADRDASSDIQAVARKRYRQMTTLPWEKVYARLGGYLARRGYEMSDIRAVLAELRQEHST